MIRNALRGFLGEYQATEQPIQQRGLDLPPMSIPGTEELSTFNPINLAQMAYQGAVGAPMGLANSLLPIGKYEDGSYGPAWPSAIMDGIEGWGNLQDSAAAARENPSLMFDDEFNRQAAGDSFLAAGLAATGGVAAGAVPDNALASNAVRAYRGASSVDDLLKKDGPLFATSSAQVADSYAPGTGNYVELGVDQNGLTRYGRARDGAVIAPLEMRFQNPMRVDAGGARWTSIPDNGSFTSTDHLAKRAQQRGHDGLIVDNVYDSLFDSITPNREPATTYAALRPGTVFSATTGEQLFSNPRTAPLAPGVINALEGSVPDNALASNAVRLEGSKPNFQIMVGDSPAGRAYVREWPDTVQLGQINIDPNFRRQGVATEAQKRIAELYGKPTVPDVSLSESEYLRWVKNDPAAVADYEKLGSSYVPRSGTSAFNAGYGGAPVPGTRAASGELFSNPKTAPLAPSVISALEGSVPDNALASNAVRRGSSGGQVDQVWGPKFDVLMGQQYRLAEAGSDYSTMYDILTGKLSKASGIEPEMRAAMEAKVRELYDAMGPEGRAAAGIFSNPRTAPLAPAAINALERNPDLPMDTASRMARARDMGFDTNQIWYHGSNADIEAFDPTRIGTKTWAPTGAPHGFYFADTPELARRYAKGDGGNITPVYLKGQDVIGNGRAAVVADPRNIRSVNAAFDPAKADSANLLAANPKEAALSTSIINALEDQAPRGIRAYHGSPHDFDRFSLDKIGTGASAQTYGPGVYLSRSEDVARGWRDKVSQRKQATAPESASALLNLHKGDTAKALAYAQKRIADPDTSKATRSMYQEAVQYLQDGPQEAGGRMYEVRINANDEDFVDWDIPLANQPQRVRDALQPVVQDLSADWRWKNQNIPEPESLGQLVVNRSDQFAQALRNAGIPGVRYTDTSGVGGQGVVNYSVFDDSLLDITRKYSNPPSAAPLSLLGQGDDEQYFDDPFLASILNRYGVTP